MRYNYACTRGCKYDDYIKSNQASDMCLIVVKSGDLVWEETHGMKEDPPIQCPLCGEKAAKTMQGMGMPVSYIRGNGYLDRAGCLRDMNLYKMENNQDPYASMRQPGEADEVKDKLRRAGKHNPKRKYFS